MGSTTVTVLESLSSISLRNPPLLPVTEIMYVPVYVYVCSTSLPVRIVPSPKFHSISLTTISSPFSLKVRIVYTWGTPSYTVTPSSNSTVRAGLRCVRSLCAPATALSTFPPEVDFCVDVDSAVSPLPEDTLTTPSGVRGAVIHPLPLL